MTKRPTDDQINDAVQWLLVNEGPNGEAESCKAVAGWLEHLQREAGLKAAARKAGVSMRNVRKYIRRVEGKEP